MKFYVGRDEIPLEYSDMMVNEVHHDHEIIEVDGILKWEPDPIIVLMVEEFGLSNMLAGISCRERGRNSESWRWLARNMGTSLSSYWENFHWNLNNPDYDEYIPNHNLFS